MPFQHEIKLSVVQPLPADFQVGFTMTNWAGGPNGSRAYATPGGARWTGLSTNWSLSKTTRYAADCPGPCTPGALVIPNMTATTYVLDLTPPGSDYYGRLNQLDLGFRKMFRIGRYQYSGQMDIFNATNSAYIKSQTTTFGPSLGQVTSTLQPITMRLAVQLKF